MVRSTLTLMFTDLYGSQTNADICQRRHYDPEDAEHSHSSRTNSTASRLRWPLSGARLSRSNLPMPLRQYPYVGPREIREVASTQPSGTAINTADDLTRWLQARPTELTVDGNWIATFTINTDEAFYLAPRRSEHVACAAGGPVLSAGEITIHNDLIVTEISNQSTGFCPEPDSWPAVENALNRIGLKHPGRFTTVVVFRLCPQCNQRNIVKDSWYYCQMCDAELPETWNFTNASNAG